MKPIVKLIIAPKIDWEEFRKYIILTVGTIKSSQSSRDFLFWLGEDSPLKTLLYPLTHLSYSFLVLCYKETLYPLINRIGTLKCHTFLTKQDMIVGVILSGTLEEFKNVIINTQEADDVTFIFNECQRCFEREGLGSIWANYVKKGDPYRLEEK